MDCQVKIDRIKSASEAETLKKLGVDMICVSIKGHSIFSDDRVIDMATAMAIRQAIGKEIKLGCEILCASSQKDTLELIDKVGCDIVQINEVAVCPPKLEQILLSKGIGIGYANVSANHEDDPSWILSRYARANADFFQVELLNEFENAWEFLKEESPKFPEELQLPDIVDLGKQYPILIALNFNSENLSEIVKAIHSMKGIALTLKGNTPLNDIRAFDFFEVTELLSIFSSLIGNVVEE